MCIPEHLDLPYVRFNPGNSQYVYHTRMANQKKINCLDKSRKGMCSRDIKKLNGRFQYVEGPEGGWVFFY